MHSSYFGVILLIFLMCVLYWITLGPAHEVMNEYCKAKHITSCDGVPNNHWTK
jgi:hypothetical protein